ncbi:MAG: hypothetical protein CYG60_18975 [Actinobacteria bacterium]|nr:MAG: hypothetical protein CYG60_18975 [Actinomycetota bacterium]
MRKQTFSIIQIETGHSDRSKTIEQVIGKGAAVERASELTTQSRRAAYREGRQYAQFSYMILNDKTRKLCLPDGRGLGF